MLQVLSRLDRSLLALAALLSSAAPLLRAIDAPVVSNALPEVHALLNYMNSIHGTKILSGQQEFPTWPWNDAAEDEIEYLQRVTGKAPAIRGFDLLFYTYSESGRQQMQVTERAIAWAQAGGIVTIGCHMFMETNSVGGPAFYVQSAAGTGAYTNIDISRAVTPGTPEYTELITKMDYLAVELKKLRDARVPVIWRPFHENSGGWFWWGAKGAAPLIAAWRLMFERYTNVHGLNNLIWEFNPGRTSDLATWYPGDAYVDMLSLDVYPSSGHPSYAADYATFQAFSGGRKLLALSENGAIPDPDLLTSQGANWVYFCTWDRTFITADSPNALAFKQTVFNHDRVLTRDELPKVHLWGRPPQFVTNPASQILAAGTSITLNSLADANETISYQWYRNGAMITNANDEFLELTNVQPGDSGTYTVRATSALGTTTSAASAVVVGPRTGRLLNLSTRGPVRTGDELMIAGFVVGGSTPRTVLIRGIGPGLVPHGIPADQVLADPQLTVFAGPNAILGNNDWSTQTSGGPDVGPVADSVSAFALTPGSPDAALVATLDPGLYTVHLTGVGGGTGIALAEVYDVSGDNNTARLLNISTRGYLATGASIMIPGIVVSEAGRTLLVRGVGPGLTGSGLSPLLPDPVVRVVDVAGNEIFTNDDWGSAATSPAVAAAAAATQAFALADASKDAAMVVTLPPGAFTVLVTDKNGASGIAIVEVYEMAP